MTAMKLLWVTLVLLGVGKWGRFVGGHGEHAAHQQPTTYRPAAQKPIEKLNRVCGSVDWAIHALWMLISYAPTVPCANTACDSFLQAGCHADEASGRQRRAMRSASVEQHSRKRNGMHVAFSH
jgi:hypothetical protein